MMLDSDVDVLNGLVQSAPKLVYEEKDVLENRRNLREMEDGADDAANEIPAGDLPPRLVAHISVAKTIEILGQFLKNHYGQLDGTIKDNLIRELFNAGLRGMRDLFEMLAEKQQVCAELAIDLKQQQAVMFRDRSPKRIA